MPQSQTRVARGIAAARRLNRNADVIMATRSLRRRLPGDGRYGDALSVNGDGMPDVVGRRLLALAADEPPTATRELGLGALQVWQALAESRGRGRGSGDVAILFLDLVEFSSWALGAGDDAVVELLRQVGRVTDRAVARNDGRVVKRLGDGVMAVFVDAPSALAAAREAMAGLRDVRVDGYEPIARIGIHQGRPRRLGADYLGVDVNIAARVAEAAEPGEVLVSGAVSDLLTGASQPVVLRPRARFSAKGAPADLRVFVAEEPAA